MPWTKWTYEDGQRCREMYADPEITMEQMLAAFPGRSERAIINQCTGVRRVSQWTDHKIAELKRLCDAGENTTVISEALGVSRNAVIGKCYRLDFPLGRSDGRKVRARHRHKTGGRTVVEQAKERIAAIKAAEPQPVQKPIEDAPRAKVDIAPVTITGLSSLSPLAAALVQAPRTQCRYPTPTGICGAPCASSGGSWCERHKQIAFTHPGRKIEA